MTSTGPAYFTALAFYSTMGMSFLCFVVFLIVAIMETVQKSKQQQKHFESLPNPGDLAVKFGTAGLAPSALACAVVLMLLGTMIALNLDNRSLVSLFK